MPIFEPFPGLRYANTHDLADVTAPPYDVITTAERAALLERHPDNAVGIDHGQGLTSMYSHLSKIAVSEGTRVERGDIVGYVGTTGRSNAPHLHWGLAVHAVNVNPLQWVSLQPCAAAK